MESRKDDQHPKNWRAGSARINEDILLAALVALNMAKTGRTYLKIDGHPICIPLLDPGKVPLLGQGHWCLRICP